MTDQASSDNHKETSTPQPTKLQRWIDLLAHLTQHRFAVERADIWKSVPGYAQGVDGTAQERATVRRTFERDKDELRALGVPIESVPPPRRFGGEEAVAYRLAPGYRLPVLQLLQAERPGEGTLAEDRRCARLAMHFALSKPEADAALRGLQELATLPAFPWAADARSAFRKLSSDLEAAVPADAPVQYAPDPEAVANVHLLDSLSASLHRGKRVTFRYRSMSRPDETNRRVRPYGLLFEQGRWYLIGHDEDRDDLRTFRVGRMHDLVANKRSPGTPDFDVPSTFRLQDCSNQKAWELGDERAEPEEADVLFRAPRSRWAERNGLGELVESRPCGGQLRRFQVRNRDSFLRWILSLLGEARIETPSEMRDDIRQMARSVARKHEGAPVHA